MVGACAGEARALRAGPRQGRVPCSLQLRAPQQSVCCPPLARPAPHPLALNSASACFCCSSSFTWLLKSVTYASCRACGAPAAAQCQQWAGRPHKAAHRPPSVARPRARACLRPAHTRAHGCRAQAPPPPGPTQRTSLRSLKGWGTVRGRGSGRAGTAGRSRVAGTWCALAMRSAAASASSSASLDCELHACKQRHRNI